MDNNIINNENINDKINQEININNDDKDNKLNISNNYELLNKIDNFNIEENEDEEDEEQNDAYIQELMKQGKYSEVIKFLDSKDKKSKRKKNKNNNEENENNSNNEDEDEEELVIIPADDISDLHEDRINNFDENENIEENNGIKNKTNENENDNTNNNNNENKINVNNENENKEDKEKNIIINNNDNNNTYNQNNIINNLNKENSDKKEENKNSLKNNFIDKQKDDNNNNKNNNNKNKNEIKNNQNNNIKKEDNIHNDNNNQNNKNKNNQNSNETNNNILSNSIISNKSINLSNNNIDIENDNIDIKPKDIIKNIISNNNLETKNKKLKKDNSSSNSLNSSSLLHLSFEEDEENNKYYEERLKDIQEQRQIFIEKALPEKGVALNNLELLTKELEELNELENNENEDLNGIEQMNEIYVMVQEDKQSSLLQEKVREKLFPFYNKANFDIKDVIKNDYFKSINFSRNFFISSKIIDNKSISKKKNNYNFNIDYPKSIFDDLKFDKSDIKIGIEFDEYLDEFLDEKNTTKNNITKTNQNIIKKNNSKVEKLFLKYKTKLKDKNKNIKDKKMNNIKPIKIYLNNKKDITNNSKIKEKYEININEIYNKYNDQINSITNNTDLKIYNNFFVDNFNKKNEIFNFNDYSIDLDLDEDIKKELNNNKNNTNNIEDKDKENYYLKINNSKSFDEKLLNNYSLLRFINLENNNLTKFPDFSKCPMIYSINMNNNKIAKIDKISSLKYLEKLSLTNNCITSIENCNNNKRLRFLFLGHNKISNIDNISTEVPFIEEIILCQNNISSFPNKIYLPYLKFFDINENKISFDTYTHHLLYFICPSLEKLLLLGNNLNENGTQLLIKYCPKLKEIDLSFNKFNNIIELVKLLCINSNWNNNLEMINIVGNTFFNNNKNKELFYLLIKRFCPSIKYINNEEIKKNKTNIIQIYNNNIYFNNFTNLNCNLNESYINIYNSHNSFMKYFTSVYFTNKIFNIYNININNNLKTSNAELFLLINQAYFQFKLSHFISQININNSNIGFFSYESNFQFNDLLIYLYKFKNRMIYITHSIPILVKRTWFRRMKIIKIQQHYKLRILRKKLAAIVIPDDEDDHAEDLLEFFNNDNKKEEEKMIDIDLGLDKKMKEIELNIEKNLKKKSKSKTNFQFLEVIKEEDKDIDIQMGINQLEISKTNNLNNNIEKKKNNELNKEIEKEINKDVNDINFNDNNKRNKKIINDINNNHNKLNHNLIKINNKIEISSINENHKEKEKEKEKDDLVKKLLSNPKYNGNGNKLNPIRLTPIIKNPNNIQSSTNITNNNNFNRQNIDKLKIGLGIGPKGNIINNIKYYDDSINQRNHHKIILKDDKNYGKLYDINEQSNLPINSPPSIPGFISGRKNEKHSSVKRPESNGVIFPKINNNLNVSKTSFSNETSSVYSHITTGKKFSNNTRKKNGKPEEILLVEQEYREAIEKAKAEWKFTDKGVEELLVKKIRKKYAKKIKDLAEKYKYKYG